ncbi:MAG: prefoldin subunit beta [Methanobacteriota archaeon]
MDIPKQLQDKLAQFQNVQNQLQMLSIQKQQLVVHSAEVENALEELGKSGKGKIYKAAGSILIETNRVDSKKFLGESKETVAARIEIVEKQEKKIAGKFGELKTEIESIIGQSAGKPPNAG